MGFQGHGIFRSRLPQKLQVLGKGSFREKLLLDTNRKRNVLNGTTFDDLECPNWPDYISNIAACAFVSISWACCTGM